MGDAIDAPLRKRQPATAWPFTRMPGARTSRVERMFAPGAATSTKSPLVERLVTWLSWSVAATARTFGNAAGYWMVPRRAGSARVLPTAPASPAAWVPCRLL